MRYGIGSGPRCVCPYCRARRRETTIALLLFVVCMALLEALVFLAGK